MTNKFDDIVIGMSADALLELHPKETFIRQPTVKRDKAITRPPYNNLIVIYHYDGVDVRIEYAQNDDSVLPMECYAVQEVTRV